MRETTDMKKLALILAAFCAVAAAALAVTYNFTAGPIALQHRLRTEALLKEMLPEAQRFEETNINGRSIWLGKTNGALAGIVVPASASGYGGPMEVFVALDETGSVVCVKVAKHSETPGIGSRATEPGFLTQFKGKQPKDPVTLGKDVQGVSGATISSRAVTSAVKDAVSAYSAARAAGKI